MGGELGWRTIHLDPKGKNVKKRKKLKLKRKRATVSGIINTPDQEPDQEKLPEKQKKSHKKACATMCCKAQGVLQSTWGAAKHKG